MSGSLRSFAGGLIAVGLAAGVAACSGGNSPSLVSPTSGPQAAVPVNPGPNPGAADVEFVEVCKNYVGGTGPVATFSIAVDIGGNGTTDQTLPLSLAAGQCKDVWATGGTVNDRLTITETVPAGYTASWVLTVRTGATVSTGSSTSGNVATGAIAKSGVGSLVVFTNTPTAPPPPPPGVAGCTPGYWKQSQHFDSWPAAYTPNMQFSAVFENAFPGMTLLQVLSQGGGGLNALGRHTVAALLSAGTVNYGMTPAQVISAFNAVFPNGDYETLHNQFAAANERGCPLN